MTNPDHAIDHHLMVAFPGHRLPDAAASLLGGHDVSGVTLFFHHNVDRAEQIRDLTHAIQRARQPGPPLLVAADQEAGQLVGLGGDTTPFAGNMALGAADDPELTRRVAAAIGTELAALGINVDYAPVADLASNPGNPAMGIRSFGDDPHRVAAHVRAFVQGLTDVGVAATLKHFPGKGDVATDTHHGLAVVGHSRQHLTDHELVPFQAGIGAGAQLVMSGHHALPAVSGRDDLPGTLSPQVMDRLLREELGFGGVSITDALDMHALAQGAGQLVDAVAALRAGNDLLLCPPDLAVTQALREGLTLAASRGLLDPVRSAAARARIQQLRRWVERTPAPALDVVGGAQHTALADELARRAVTLVRDDEGLLPLRLVGDGSILAVMTEPTDRTPADTTSSVRPGLAAALRAVHGAVTEVVVPEAPTSDDVAGIVAQARRHQLVVVATAVADQVPAQAGLVHALLATGTPVIAVAVRTPWDLAAYPQAPTYLCTYGAHQPSMRALVQALMTGHAPGRLPVAATW